jgi:hypothetical protein
MTEPVVLQGGRGGRGNVVLLFDGARVLKLYRPRSSALREGIGELWAQFALRKRGFSARSRYETEAKVHEVWRRSGFGVLRRLDLPLPADVAGPGLWFEFCAAPRLTELLPDRPALLGRLAADMDRRHALALDRREPRLIHEHGEVGHYFVEGDRLLAFDFEATFLRGHPMLEAMADEIAGVLRSAAQVAGDAVFAAFKEGYGDARRLRRIVQIGVAGGSLRRRLRRWADRGRRSRYSKAEVLGRVGQGSLASLSRFFFNQSGGRERP